MALSRKIEISDFSVGLISDLDSAELPLSACSRLENADVRNKKLETQPGILEVNTGLPSGFTKLSEEQFKFTVPSEQNCVITHGTLSGVHKLYIRPYLSLAGAWVDSWIELTERETSLTADAGTNTTTIVDAGLSSTTTDYYKGWFLFNSTRSKGAIVTAYNGSTKTLTLSWAIGSQTTGDSYFLSRNPLFDTDASAIYSLPSAGCRFLQDRENFVSIVTGSDAVYDSDITPNKVDLVLTVLNNREALNDSDLTFTGFFLARKPPATIRPQYIYSLSAAVLAGSDVELPADTNRYYVVLPVAVYDGYQEGAIYEGGVPQNSATYTTSEAISFATAARKLKIDLSLDYSYGTNPSLVEPYSEGADYKIIPFWDRRITAIRIYAAQADPVGDIRPSSEFRFVEEIKIDSSSWSGSGPNYTQTVYITGDKWEAGAGIDVSDRQGHSSTKIHANANFIAGTGNGVAVANVFADEKRQAFVFFAAKNSDGLVMPDVLPHTSFANLSTFGIPAIKAFVESLGFYIAFGENILVKIDGTTFGVDNNIQAYGTSSANAVKNVNRLIYFAGLDDCFYYHPLQNVVRSLMTGFVREAWRALSTSDKQAAAIGFDKRLNVLVISAGTQIFVYNLPASFASDLAQDTSAIGSFSAYSVGKTFLKFYTSIDDGACIGIASDGKSYKLFSSGASNSLVYEKIIGESNFNIAGLQITYNATTAFQVKIFDMARNANSAIQTYNFPAQSLHKKFSLYKGCQARRPKIKIESSLGMSISKFTINPDVINDD